MKPRHRIAIACPIRLGLAALVILSLNAVPATAAGFQTDFIEGWSVLVNGQLPAADRKSD